VHRTLGAIHARDREFEAPGFAHTIGSCVRIVLMVSQIATPVKRAKKRRARIRTRINP